jgi:single-stranded-DNA-specific exonuclease
LLDDQGHFWSNATAYGTLDGRANHALRNPFLCQDDMPKLWRFAAHDVDRIARMQRDLSVSPVVAQLLLGRGIDDVDVAREFLSCRLSSLRDPESVPGAAAAGQRIARAIREQRKIVLYGDYDVDGMTSTALMHRCLRMLGGDVAHYIPSRLDEGYGLNREAIEKLAGDGAQLIVTVDCGIASVTEVAAARAAGVEIIVTDHHQPGATLPDADEIVHPGLPGHDSPFAGLCGAGVAFKLAWSVCKQMAESQRVSDRMRQFLLDATSLAALATVADMVPLVDENRVLVRHGLMRMVERPSLGLRHLMRVAGLDKKKRLESDDIGFALAPRLNAAGRLGQARLGVELLITDSDSRAAELADYIDQLNQSRQSLERSIYKLAQRQLTEQFDVQSDPALVVAGHGWHAGVIGIVAGRLAERYHRPTVVIALDQAGVKAGVGSVRSIPGVDVHAALVDSSDHLISCGGHRAAAGLRIEEKQIDAFRTSFCEHIASQCQDELPEAEIHIDAESPLGTMTLQTLQQIDQLAPFGEGNRRPIVCTTGVHVDGQPKRIGGGGRHLSLQFVQDGVRMRAVSFGNGDWVDELGENRQPLDIAFEPIVNDFAGRRRVELRLTDWRVSSQVATR